MKENTEDLKMPKGLVILESIKPATMIQGPTAEQVYKWLNDDSSEPPEWVGLACDSKISWRDLEEVDKRLHPIRYAFRKKVFKFKKLIKRKRNDKIR